MTTFDKHATIYLAIIALLIIVMSQLVGHLDKLNMCGYPCYHQNQTTTNKGENQKLT
jgi:hypothetical protein